eukprot:364201-Chlamydomonas_euryale.AAC.1
MLMHAVVHVDWSCADYTFKATDQRRSLHGTGRHPQRPHTCVTRLQESAHAHRRPHGRTLAPERACMHTPTHKPTTHSPQIPLNLHFWGLGFLGFRVCEDMKIQSQNDTTKLAEAKGIVYLKGFNEGVLCVGPHAGKKVSEVKPIIRNEMLASGQVRRAHRVFSGIAGVVACLVALREGGKGGR